MRIRWEAFDQEPPRVTVAHCVCGGEVLLRWTGAGERARSIMLDLATGGRHACPRQAAPDGTEAMERMTRLLVAAMAEMDGTPRVRQGAIQRGIDRTNGTSGPPLTEALEF